MTHEEHIWILKGMVMNLTMVTQLPPPQASPHCRFAISNNWRA